MPTGCHVRRRICAAAHGPPTPVARSQFHRSSARDPFASLQSLRCFGSDTSVELVRPPGLRFPLSASSGTHRLYHAQAAGMETSVPTATPANKMPERTGRVTAGPDVGTRISESVNQSGSLAVDPSDTPLEQSANNESQLHIESQVSEPVDLFSEAQTDAQIRDHSSESTQSVMVALPPFENDGIKLFDLGSVRRKAESFHTRLTRRKREAERQMRFDPKHPVEWDDLFDMLRRYTPRQRSDSRPGRGGSAVAASEPTSAPVQAGIASQSHDPNAYPMAPDSAHEFKELFDFINARVPKSTLRRSRNRTPRLIDRLLLFYEGIAPPVFASISTSIIDASIQFLLKHRQLPDAMRLFFKIRASDLKPQISTLNVFLRNAAQQQHMNGMEKFLKMIITAGLTPNPQTWVALLLSAPTEGKKLAALEEMRRRGFLADPAARRAVIPLVMTRSLDAHLDKALSVDGYINNLNSLCGSTWVSEQAVDKILTSLMSRGQTDDALRVLLSLKESYNFQPRALQLRRILGHHVRSQDLASAVRTCARFDTLFGQAESGRHCALLFSLAWRFRYYNVAKVAWKYAVKPTYWMKFRVMRSINAAHDRTTPGSRRSDWMKKAGYVICDHYPTVSDRKAWHARQMPDWMDGELNLFRHISLTESFSTMLLRAWHVDQAWLQNNIRQTKTIPWMLEHGVHIPIAIKRDGGELRARGRTAAEIGSMATQHADKLAAIDKVRQADVRERAVMEEVRLDTAKKAKVLVKKWSRQERYDSRQAAREACMAMASNATSQRRIPTLWRAVYREDQRVQDQRDWWDVGWSEASGKEP